MVTLSSRSLPRSGGARLSSLSPLMMRSVIRDDSFLSVSPSNSTIEEGNGGAAKTPTVTATTTVGDGNYETFHGGCAPIRFVAIQGSGNPCCAYDGNDSLTRREMPPSPRSVTSPFFFRHRVGVGAVHVMESVSFDDDDLSADSVDSTSKDRHLSRPNVHIVVGEECNEFDAILDTRVRQETDLKRHSPSFMYIEAESSSADDNVSEDPSFSVIASYLDEDDDDDDVSTPPPAPLLSAVADKKNKPTAQQSRNSSEKPRQHGDTRAQLYIPSLRKRVHFGTAVFETYEMDLDERKTVMFFSPEELRCMRVDWEASVSAFMDLTRKKRMTKIHSQLEEESPVEGNEDEETGNYRGLEHWMSPMHWHRWKRRRAMVLGAVMEEQAEQKLHRQCAEPPASEDQSPAETHAEVLTSAAPQNAEEHEDEDVRESPLVESRAERKSHFAYDFLLCSQAAAEVSVSDCASPTSSGRHHFEDTTSSDNSWQRPLLHSSGSIAPNEDDALKRLAEVSRVWSNRDRRTALRLAEEDRVWVRVAEVDACLLSMWSCGME